MNKQLYILLAALALTGCTLSNEEVRERMWKYGEGCHIGDFPAFGDYRYELRNDTIFCQGIAKAVIIDTDKNYFLRDTEITIRCIGSGEQGTYHDLGKAD